TTNTNSPQGNVSAICPNITANEENQNFTGTKTRSTLTGTLLNTTPQGFIPLNGGLVHISSTTNDFSRVVPANPVYVLSGLLPGTYVVTPERNGIVFSPSSLVVQVSLTDQAINFRGQPS